MPKVEFDKEACIGCGACASICDNWVMDENDNKAKPRKISINTDELAKNKEAEDVCPVNCIKVVG